MSLRRVLDYLGLTRSGAKKPLLPSRFHRPVAIAAVVLGSLIVGVTGTVPGVAVGAGVAVAGVVLLIQRSRRGRPDGD